MKPTSESVTGFDQAWNAMRCYEARSRVNDKMARTMFLNDERIAFVHVDSSSRPDHMVLTAFGGNGARLGVETICNDDGGGLDLAPEFSHRPTRPVVPAVSDLDQVGEDGWIIAMNALRAYDADADRRKTQKTIVVAHLQDMVKDGEARCFLFGESLMAPETSVADQPDIDPPGKP
ncbi:hypothetical protein ACFOY4_01575 [Actinomadura syzygii]|uniref:Uncharacterized protein n=1 Tax=Actinomadura syzygii TaxID=1427538 RepID=A0A5D0TS13_9ACTN|nr:hypothetical protein [Actinomadura syzygii]TYC08564.1 hypothetical protein FXF65_37350 [Actinomadura syzygii]